MLALASLLAIPPRQVVSAQCKNLSQCKSCHEQQAQKPVNASGQWHIDHQIFDFCFACHSGQREATDASVAHDGMLLKLEDMPGNCKTCHAADLNQKYKVYADALGVSSTIDPKKLAAGATPEKNISSFLGGKAPQNITQKNGPAGPKPQSSTGNWVLFGMMAVIAAGGGWYVVRNERRLGNAVPPRRLSRFFALLRQESWTPYAAGVLLGVTCILTVLLTNRLLGASTGVATIASTLFNAAAPQVAQNQMYFKFIMTPGLTFEVLLILGMMAGGFLSALASRTFRLRWNDDPTWRKVFGPQTWKRLLIGFFGAILIQFGAGLAGGCTSGLAISGGMLFAPSAFIFMAGMFAAGIVVALILYGKKY